MVYNRHWRSTFPLFHITRAWNQYSVAALHFKKIICGRISWAVSICDMAQISCCSHCWRTQETPQQNKQYLTKTGTDPDPSQYLRVEMPRWRGQHLGPWTRQPPCSLSAPAGGTRPCRCPWSLHTPQPAWTCHCGGDGHISTPQRASCDTLIH